MRRSDLRRAIQETVSDASGMLVDLDKVYESIDATCGIGFPSGTIGGGGGKGGDVSSIVERHALQRDQADLDRRRLEQLVAWVHQSMAEVTVIRLKYTAKPRKGRTNRKGGDMGCEMMALIGEFEEGRLTDVGGILDRQRRLSRWAIEFVARVGRLPTRPEIETHARGGRVRATA